MGGGRGEYGVWDGGRGKPAVVFAFLGGESVANSRLANLLGTFVPGREQNRSVLPKRPANEQSFPRTGHEH